MPVARPTVTAQKQEQPRIPAGTSAPTWYDLTKSAQSGNLNYYGGTGTTNVTLLGAPANGLSFTSSSLGL